MTDKLIKIEHKVCDYTCMWNGIEDLYHHKTKELVPDFFFFCLSGIGNFVYRKNNSGELRRMVSWSDGRTKLMYRSINDIVGFRYKWSEGASFSYTLKKAKEQIDSGNPVILGCLDMFYLDYYPKFYLQYHIPIHYVMMVGYNDEKQGIYIVDCGEQDVQTLSYTNLEKALNVKKTSLGDKNGICMIDFQDNGKPLREIAAAGFSKKAKLMLAPPVGFIGIKGMRKLAQEIGNWQEELSGNEYEKALSNLVMFTGTVPLIPARIYGGRQEEDIQHQAAREKLGPLLIDLGERFSLMDWEKSGRLFCESGEMIQKMTNLIVDYLLKTRTDLNELPGLIEQIADIEEQAFHAMLDGGKK